MPEVAKDSASGARAGNAVWFATAVSPNPRVEYAPIFMLTFSIDTNSVVEISVDNGVSFTALRDEVGGTTFNANQLYTRPIPVRSGDLFNVRATAAVTITFARLDEFS